MFAEIFYNHIIYLPVLFVMLGNLCKLLDLNRERFFINLLNVMFRVTGYALLFFDIFHRKFDYYEAEIKLFPRCQLLAIVLYLEGFIGFFFATTTFLACCVTYDLTDVTSLLRSSLPLSVMVVISLLLTVVYSCISFILAVVPAKYFLIVCDILLLIFWVILYSSTIFPNDPSRNRTFFCDNSNTFEITRSFERLFVNFINYVKGHLRNLPLSSIFGYS